MALLEADHNRSVHIICLLLHSCYWNRLLHKNLLLNISSNIWLKLCTVTHTYSKKMLINHVLAILIYCYTCIREQDSWQILTTVVMCRRQCGATTTHQVLLLAVTADHKSYDQTQTRTLPLQKAHLLSAVHHTVPNL